MSGFYLGVRVRPKRGRRRPLGTVIGHHPTMPWWLVDFKQRKRKPLYWTEDQLEVIA